MSPGWCATRPTRIPARAVGSAAKVRVHVILGSPMTRHASASTAAAWSPPISPAAVRREENSPTSPIMLEHANLPHGTPGRSAQAETACDQRGPQLRVTASVAVDSLCKVHRAVRELRERGRIPERSSLRSIYQGVRSAWRSSRRRNHRPWPTDLLTLHRSTDHASCRIAPFPHRLLSSEISPGRVIGASRPRRARDRVERCPARQSMT